jgi:hypothetical protein
LPSPGISCRPTTCSWGPVPFSSQDELPQVFNQSSFTDDQAVNSSRSSEDGQVWNLFEQADPWSAVEKILGLETKQSKMACISLEDDMKKFLTTSRSGVGYIHTEVPQGNEPSFPLPEVRKNEEPPDWSFTLDDDLSLLDDTEEPCPFVRGGTPAVVGRRRRPALQMNDAEHDHVVDAQSGALRSQSTDDARLDETLPGANQLYQPSDAPELVPGPRDCDEEGPFLLRPLFSDSLSDSDVDESHIAK